MAIDQTTSNTLILWHGVTVNYGFTLPIYGSVRGGDNYFAQNLDGDIWEDASPDRRIKALIKATKLIDRLNFIGSKASEDQALQFPRGTDVVPPVDIIQACYEIALKLLDDRRPDKDAENLVVTAQGYAATRTTYDRVSVLDHVRAGIPSATAWDLLSPYLIDPTTVKLSRVN